MSIVETLITDRTAADVAKKAKKGYYNYDDLNRVGAAMAYLRERLNESGYSIDISPRTTWTERDIPTISDMTLYLSQLAIIRAALALPPDTPKAPDSMSGLTWARANDIEKILETVDRMLSNSIAAMWHSGDLYAGEVM